MFAGGGASIAAFLWNLYDKLNGITDSKSIVFLVLALAMLSVGYIYSIKVRSENIVLRDLSRVFSEINIIYRNRLFESFAAHSPITNPGELLDTEKCVLRAVCQRIASGIFSRVINRPCMVTIKLASEHNGKSYAQTYVRSQDECDRDHDVHIKYWLLTGENTAFDEALKNRTDGKVSHYYSPNILREHGYSNQRQHFDRYYKSVLVVPMRGERKDRKGTTDEFDLIGFLCVDTLSTNRLNNGYHLHMLSALASQMYNFISLMRGRYTVLVDSET